jgi:hypothetical protein
VGIERQKREIIFLVIQLDVWTDEAESAAGLGFLFHGGEKVCYSFFFFKK